MVVSMNGMGVRIYTETHVNISVLVEPCESLEGGFYIFGWDVTDGLSFEDANKPPIRV